MPDSAYKYLHMGALKGLMSGHKTELEKDKSLTPLTTRKDWPALRDMLAANEDRAGTNDSLKKVLTTMYEKDQKFRKIYHSDTNKRFKDSMQTIGLKTDKEDQEQFKKILSMYGWPGFKLVGRSGEATAWILAQHSDIDTVFQEKCLELLEDAIRKNDALPSHLAYLIDRRLVNEGRPQIYGTQFREQEVNGVDKLVPCPLKDEKNVDKWRCAVGLERLQKYLDNSTKYFITGK